MSQNSEYFDRGLLDIAGDYEALIGATRSFDGVSVGTDRSKYHNHQWTRVLCLRAFEITGAYVFPVDDDLAEAE